MVSFMGGVLVVHSAILFVTFALFLTNPARVTMEKQPLVTGNDCPKNESQSGGEESRALVLWNYAKVPPFWHTERTMPLLGRSIRIKQIPSGNDDHSLGTVLWDGAFVLCKYLESHVSSAYFSDKTVVELGSGTGLLGIFVSLFGAKEVIMTDFESQLSLIEENVKANVPDGHKTRTEVLVWGENLREFVEKVPKIDAIVASDVVYNHYALSALLQTLVYLSKAGHTEDAYPEIFMSYKPRYKPEEKFFHWYRRHFDVSEVPKTMLAEEFRFSGLTIFRARLKSQKSE